ncbi:transporter substrate-binding domain-containing protein [Falsirhodobacter algicola]|uniref:Transporter substrate-binding domain-containing protein n=1 Tax=Falsirhodobacter algicola TaxID=2692330 RepID=A0A8J8MU45_9RHOB|nr:transporter substrate-binding domain-containing protein [Falsirhodobacter algicola]QUS36766.1 transporter substrate-binding domain-containing protein [Falsirhodobacter algicola]
MTVRTYLGAIALSLVAGAAMPALADTLDDIKARGSVIVAIDVSHPPYGMLDSATRETGSDVETAQLLAEDLGVKLQLVPVSGANRVPFLLSNKVDVVIASFSITDERRKVIDYSRPYGVIPVVISAPEGEAITEAQDLAGKAIAVARGTTADIELTRLVKDTGVRANIVRYEDEATATTAVATGQQKMLAAALSTANALAEQNPGLGLEVKMNMASYPMAIGLRKDEPALKEALDGWVLANLQNGKLNGIYEKYFHQSLPADLAE